MKEAQISYMLKKIPMKRFGLRSIEARLECSHGGENDRYDAIVADYRQFADSIGIKVFWRCRFPGSWAIISPPDHLTRLGIPACH
jgi:hypothetical protein